MCVCGLGSTADVPCVSAHLGSNKHWSSSACPACSAAEPLSLVRQRLQTETDGMPVTQPGWWRCGGGPLGEDGDRRDCHAREGRDACRDEKQRTSNGLATKQLLCSLLSRCLIISTLLSPLCVLLSDIAPRVQGLPRWQPLSQGGGRAGVTVADRRQQASVLCPPKLKVRTPAHTKHLGWYLGFQFRVTHRPTDLKVICVVYHPPTHRPFSTHANGTAAARGGAL